LVKEAHRVLTEGGRLSLDFINPQAGRSGRPAQLYSQQQIANILSLCGFTNVKFFPMGIFLYLHNNQELTSFANKYRDIFSKIEIELKDCIKLNRGIMIFATATKS